jgi:predicted dehydrogenase
LTVPSIAIVGAGGIGRVRAETIRDLEVGRVSWVADVDAGRAQELAARTSARATLDWREAVRDPEVDAVIISSPTKFHAEISIQALKAGKHVLCEKPLARTVEEALAMVEAARCAGRVLMTGFNFRQMGHVRKALELLKQGAIGIPYFLRCCYGHGGRPGYDQHWCADAELSGGGVLQEQGIHMVDLVRVLLGEPVKVMAETQCYFWGFREVEDNCFCLFETASGRLAQVHTSWTQWKNLFEVEIFGHDGYLRLEGRDGHYGPQRLTWAQRQPSHGRPVEEIFTFEEAESAWAREWCEFMRLMQDGAGSMEVARQGLETQQLIEAAYQSAREHAWVEILPLVRVRV